MNTNNYCVWSLKVSIDYPEANVYRYNQTKLQGEELAKSMNNMFYDDKDFYYCTEQAIGSSGESLGPHKHDVISKFVNV